MKYAITVNEVKDSPNGLKGFASVTLGDSFKITNVAILENKEKGELFVSMPRYKSSQRNEDNEPVYKDVCNPITKEFREELYSTILQAYENVKNKTDEKQVKKTDNDNTEGQDNSELKFSVSVSLLEREGSDVKGLARIFIEDCFVINNVSIIQGKENLFVAMPEYKTKKMDENDRPIYQDVSYPITKEFREKLYGIILEKHQKELEKAKRDAERLSDQSECVRKDVQKRETR